MNKQKYWKEVKKAMKKSSIGAFELWLWKLTRRKEKEKKNAQS